jgi:hypothetical protein
MLRHGRPSLWAKRKSSRIIVAERSDYQTSIIPSWQCSTVSAHPARVVSMNLHSISLLPGTAQSLGLPSTESSSLAIVCTQKAGLEHIAPHDLRRTCAKLCHTNGGEIEQIQFLLGHASVQTTERYLGCKQNLGHPVNDLFRLDIAVIACAVARSVMIAKPDRIVYEHGVSSDQEGADARTSARHAGYGNSSV